MTVKLLANVTIISSSSFSLITECQMIVIGTLADHLSWLVSAWRLSDACIYCAVMWVSSSVDSCEIFFCETTDETEACPKTVASLQLMTDAYIIFPNLNCGEQPARMNTCEYETTMYRNVGYQWNPSSDSCCVTMSVAAAVTEMLQQWTDVETSASIVVETDPESL